MRISNEGILVILFVGLIAGWLAGKIVRGTGFGIIGDILVGIAGALVASYLFPKLGIVIGSGLVSEIIYSAIGAVILLLVVRLIRTGGRFGCSADGAIFVGWPPLAAAVIFPGVLLCYGLAPRGSLEPFGPSRSRAVRLYLG